MVVEGEAPSVGGRAGPRDQHLARLAHDSEIRCQGPVPRSAGRVLPVDREVH